MHDQTTYHKHLIQDRLSRTQEERAKEEKRARHALHPKKHKNYSQVKDPKIQAILEERARKRNLENGLF